MSSGNERPKFVIWVPDLASQTGWSGVQVRGDETERDQRRERVIGFRSKERHERSG